MRYPTNNGCRTRARCEPDDQKQEKYGTGSNRDSLQKTEKDVSESHGSIMEFRGGLSDITKMLAPLVSLVPQPAPNCDSYCCCQSLCLSPAACVVFASAPGALRKIAGTLWFFIMSFRATKSPDRILLH